MNKEKIINLLREELYAENIIASTVEDILNMSELIQSAFEQYLTTGKEPNISVEGYSFQSLVKEYKMKKAGAFLTLDWLTKDPNAASAALKDVFL